MGILKNLKDIIKTLGESPETEDVLKEELAKIVNSEPMLGKTEKEGINGMNNVYGKNVLEITGIDVGEFTKGLRKLYNGEIDTASPKKPKKDGLGKAKEGIEIVD